MMKHLKLFENLNLIPKFHIDIRGCSYEDKIKALNLLEESVGSSVYPTKLEFNGTTNKEQFASKKDTQGFAWCWSVSHEKTWDFGIFKFHISGIHSPDWGMPEIGETMITLKEFLQIGPENVEMFLSTKKYNL